MAGQKRTRSGDPKSQSAAPPHNAQDTHMTDTPPCGQAQAPSKDPKAPKPTKPAPSKAEQKTQPQQQQQRTNTKPQTPHPARKHTPKRPRLPSHATISKRPLLHPALPSPFAAAASPKVLYITASSPFIPACKRIRALLVQIQKRCAQSDVGRVRTLQKRGRISHHDVEASIVDAAGNAKGKGGGRRSTQADEEVYVKATGRAIPRALELGVAFQGDDECRVRVEMGSVQAIDDVCVKSGLLDAEGEGNEDEEEVPETRIRTLSTVTVCIGLV